MSESTIVEGKHNGIFRRWYENGTLAEEIEMHNGTPEGLSKSFYPSGYLKAQVHLTNGQPLDQQFWKDREKPAN
jgi:antitoxin component YwqK of YwqJK toxin-antitoxin module